jgi:hypothetical protein
MHVVFFVSFIFVTSWCHSIRCFSSSAPGFIILGKTNCPLGQRFTVFLVSCFLIKKTTSALRRKNYKEIVYRFLTCPVVEETTPASAASSARKKQI